MYIIRPYNQLHQIHVKMLRVNNFVCCHLRHPMVIPVNANQDTELMVVNALKVIDNMKIVFF